MRSPVRSLFAMGRLLAWSVLWPLPAFADWPTSPLTNVAVCTTLGQQAPTGIAPDGAGGALITWSDSRLGPGNSDIYVQRVLAAGTVDPAWPLNGQLICTASGDQLAPAIVSDGSGGAIVAWQDLRAGTTSDVYAQHVLAAGIADPAWPRDGRAVCTAPGDQEDVSLLADNAGGALVIWRDFRGGTTQAVFAEHVLANGSVDAAWPVNGRSLLTQPNTFDRPTRIPALADGHGGAIVVWENWNGGATDDLAAQHVRANGTLDPAWPAAGRAVCTAINNQLDPCLVADGGVTSGGGSGAIVCWDDARGSSIDIYAQHVRADGSLDPAWPADGRLICGAAGDQVTPAAASDASGGALITWVDARSGSGDIYAQRVLAGGGVAAGWPVDGLAVCAVTGDQVAPAATVDGFGGMLVAWVDSRNVDTGPDVFAEHVLASGALGPAWPSTGRAVCAAAGAQSGILMLADGSGGAILTWNDQRGGDQNDDVYAQRVQANGVLGGTVVDVPFDASHALQLAAVQPNPWRGGALRLEYSLQSEQPATLEVMDIAGRRVAGEDLLPHGAGRGSTTITLPNRLAPGIYLVRLVQAGAVRTRRFAVLD